MLSYNFLFYQIGTKKAMTALIELTWHLLYQPHIYIISSEYTLSRHKSIFIFHHRNCFDIHILYPYERALFYRKDH